MIRSSLSGEIPSGEIPSGETPSLTAYKAVGHVSSAAEKYRQDGYVLVRDLVDPGTVSACLDELGRLQEVQHRLGPIVTGPLEEGSSLLELAGDPRLIALAWDLLGAQPIPFGCSFIVKEAFTGPPALWHQDGLPWRSALGISEAVTLWLALDCAGPSTGGLMVIPGTQRMAAQALRANEAVPNVFGVELNPELVDELSAVALEMVAGDVSAHHPNLVHGSPPNRSGHPRRALAIRYRSNLEFQDPCSSS